MRQRFGLKTGDICLMAGMLVLAAFLFLFPFFAVPSARAEIVKVETGEVQIISLSQAGEYEIESRGITLSVCVEDGKAFVSHSDCRDGICRNTPPVSRPGQSILCAPAGVIVRVLGEEAVVDAISG